MEEKCKRFTKDEDLVILSEVKANPQNLQNAFRDAACKLVGRTPVSISLRWYRNLKFKEEHCFFLVGGKSFSKNQKNSAQSIPVKQSKLKRIIKILFE